MNDRVTISLLQLFELVRDAESARHFLEESRWVGRVDAPDGATAMGAVHGNVQTGSTAYTDGASAYRQADGLYYGHASVNHSAGEYVRGDLHTNG